MPRVGVREGHFVEVASGRVVVPRGFNYIRLEHAWHRTFKPGAYDSERAEQMLQDLSSRGFNVVRVFIDPWFEGGIMQSADATGFSDAYVANLLDFLQRAERARVWVVLCAAHLPWASRYTSVAGPARPDASGMNRWYMDEGAIRAKAAYVADIVRAIKERNPRLLTVVWAYELENEAAFNERQLPLVRRQGAFRGPGGGVYRLDDPAAAQVLMDDAVVAWADECVSAVRAVDAEAMVTASVFTFQAVGLAGPGRWRPTVGHGDRRVPARLMALARSRLSYLDLHLYPFNERTLDKDLASVEWKAVREVCRQRGLPVIVGEFGAFKSAYPSLLTAAEALARHVQRITQAGFAGYLCWTYDCDEQAAIWNARSGRREILAALQSAEAGGCERLTVPRGSGAD